MMEVLTDLTERLSLPESFTAEEIQKVFEGIMEERDLSSET
jgi:hypothetical protein